MNRSVLFGLMGGALLVAHAWFNDSHAWPLLWPLLGGLAAGWKAPSSWRAGLRAGLASLAAVIVLGGASALLLAGPALGNGFDPGIGLRGPALILVAVAGTAVFALLAAAIGGAVAGLFGARR